MSKKFVYTLLSFVFGFSVQGFASEKNLDMGVSPTCVDGLVMSFSSEDLLFDAVKNGNQVQALSFIEDGASVGHFTSLTGWNELMVHALSTTSFDVAVKLIEKGVSVQCVNSFGATYAHAMAEEGNLGSLKFLKEQGLDLDSHGAFYEDKVTCRGITIERPVDIALVWHKSKSPVYKYLYDQLSEDRKKQTKAKLTKLVKRLFRL